jgi:hypothetical protein
MNFSQLQALQAAADDEADAAQYVHYPVRTGMTGVTITYTAKCGYSSTNPKEFIKLNTDNSMALVTCAKCKAAR